MGFNEKFRLIDGIGKTPALGVSRLVQEGLTKRIWRRINQLSWTITGITRLTGFNKKFGLIGGIGKTPALGVTRPVQEGSTKHIRWRINQLSCKITGKIKTPNK